MALPQPFNEQENAPPFYIFVNPLLFFLLLFSFSLLIFTCLNAYTFLPTADTWAHVDFIASAAEGRLDIASLFQKHNNVHLLVLPKLVYFLDAWLGKGAGWLTCGISLAFIFFSAVLFCYSLLQWNNRFQQLNKHELLFLCLASSLLLTSPIQAESLLNPANVQWSLLNFFAILTAYSFYAVFIEHNKYHFVLSIIGIAGVALSSASAWLILVPFLLTLACVYFPGRIFTLKTTLVIALISFVVLVIETFRAWYFPGFPSLFIVLLIKTNLLEVGSSEFDQAQGFINQQPIQTISYFVFSFVRFISDYLAPAIERFKLPIINLLFLVVLVFYYFRSLASNKVAEESKSINGLAFFKLLLLFTVVTGISIGLLRSFSPSAYTFRFSNLGVLFNASLFVVIFIFFRTKILHRFSRLFILAYLILLTVINSSEAMQFVYGRNHIRLTQVAYALDVRDSFVIAAMPGTFMEKPAYDLIQKKKHQLQKANVGVYTSEPFQQIGKSILSLPLTALSSCKNDIKKMRRLTPQQAAYRIKGSTYTDKGESLTRIYFTDSNHIIRGYGIVLYPSRSLWGNVAEDRYWAGFVNLENSSVADVAFLYAHNQSHICPAETVKLPVYRKHVKKRK